ncbi:hypothetical protein JZ751_017854 [Albula glossodonta]|uniref:Uncharacterized protein n=1 Tax=Albula glossodonta TaxID=121402 RepID=A0A8T2PPM1_9TELE|nr:hypothetical protein JZ751_017854 [Albula glossodonta]
MKVIKEEGERKGGKEKERGPASIFRSHGNQAIAGQQWGNVPESVMARNTLCCPLITVLNNKEKVSPVFAQHLTHLCARTQQISPDEEEDSSLVLSILLLSRASDNGCSGNLRGEGQAGWPGSARNHRQTQPKANISRLGWWQTEHHSFEHDLPRGSENCHTGQHTAGCRDGQERLIICKHNWRTAERERQPVSLPKYELDNPDEQAAQIRRELDGRLQMADQIARVKLMF